MKHGRATEEIQERAALYALGALTQHEARSFEIHLREECPVCQTLLSHFEKIAQGLGYATPEVEPAFYLRDIIAARIEREARVGATGQAPQDLKEAPTGRKSAQQQSLTRPYLASVRKFLPWFVTLFFTLAALLSFYAWMAAKKRVDQAVGEEKGRAAASRVEMKWLRDLLETGQAHAKESDQISAALASPGVQVLFLAPQQAEAHAAIVVFWDKEKNRGVVTGQLAPAPPGKDYQIWFMSPRSKTSLGLLEPGATGHVFKMFDMPPEIAGANMAAITIEPKGGSEQPTARSFALSR